MSLSRLSLLFFALLAATGLRASQTFGLSLTNPGMVKIDAESLLNEIPCHGHFPLRFTIENHSGRELSWNVSLDLRAGNEVRSHQATLRVPDGRTQAFDFVLPVPLQDENQWSGRSFQGTIAGPGLTDNPAHLYKNTTWQKPEESAYVGVLSGLADRVSLSDINCHSSSTGVPSRALARLVASGVPTDPLAFTGLEEIWMDGSEWLGLSPAFQLTLLDWAALGGTLRILDNFPPGSDAAWKQNLPPSLRAQPSPRGTVLPHGLGRIVRAGPKKNDQEQKKEIAEGATEHLGFFSLNHSSPDTLAAWADQKGITAVRLGGVIIVVFLIIFTIVAGPVNLFVFARGARRWRLFITTPLISLVASALLVILMFLQDGLGGAGARSRVALLLPEGGHLALRQFSASKTGLLTSSSFTLEDAPALWRLPSEENRRRNQRRFTTDGAGRFSGDFFASRSRIFHETVAYTPSTWKIVRQPDENGKPVLLSTADAVLGPVFLVDGEGKAWRAEQLALGGKSVMQASDPAEISAFLQDCQKDTPGGDVLKQLSRSRNIILAKASNLKAPAADLHPAIRWDETDTVLVTTPAAP